jgi:hypothetical protein
MPGKFVYVVEIDGQEVGRRTSGRPYTFARVDLRETCNAGCRWPSGACALEHGLSRQWYVMSWHHSEALAYRSRTGGRVVPVRVLREVQERGPLAPEVYALRRARKDGKALASRLSPEHPRSTWAGWEDWQRREATSVAHWAHLARPDLRLGPAPCMHHGQARPDGCHAPGTCIPCDTNSGTAAEGEL